MTQPRNSAHAIKPGPNQKVFAVLQKSKKPLTAYEILAKLEQSGISGPPTVYRALAKLIKDGVAHRIESLNAFIACRTQHSHNHQHSESFAVCKSCGDVAEINDDRLDKIVSGWSKSAKFSTERATMEIIGLCGDCNQHQVSA